MRQAGKQPFICMQTMLNYTWPCQNHISGLVHALQGLCGEAEHRRLSSKVVKIGMPTLFRCSAAGQLSRLRPVQSNVHPFVPS